MAVLGQGMSIVTTEQVRAENCLAEVKRVLAAHRCQILPQIVIVGAQIVQSGYVVVPDGSPPANLKG